MMALAEFYGEHWWKIHMVCTHFAFAVIILSARVQPTDAGLTMLFEELGIPKDNFHWRIFPDSGRGIIPFIVFSPFYAGIAFVLFPIVFARNVVYYFTYSTTKPY